jgi:hypothetical protein
MVVSCRRLWRFVLVMFRPHRYVAYGVLWTLALEATAAGHWRPSAATVARATSVVLTLLFLRMVDEQKDLDYDRVHHPDRPLVTGAISVAELRAAMAAITVVVVAVNAPISAVSVALALLVIGYGLALYRVERRFAAVRDGMLLNLVVTHPVQSLLSCYLYLSLVTSGAVGADWRGVPVVLVFSFVFLHFEFARKTRWHGDPGERLYSVVLGPVPSAVTALGCAVAAVVLMIMLTTWWPALLLVPPAYGALRFLSGASESWPPRSAMVFVLVSCLSLVAYGLR